MNLLAEAKLQVAQGSRILAQHGVLDAFGHVSVRSPERPDRFLIPRNLAPALVTPDDVVELDLDGVAIAEHAGKRLFLERFIHGEIYRARPDVGAVVHSHAPEVLPFTVVPGAVVRPICHMCGFLQGTPAPFDVADHEGDATDLLIGTAALGRALAEHLGPNAVALMRAHGFTAVGSGVPQAVYRAIYTARNCAIELSARQLGTPVFLGESGALACEATIGTQTDRPWNLWVSQLSDASIKNT